MHHGLRYVALRFIAVKTEVIVLNHIMAQGCVLIPQGPDGLLMRRVLIENRKGAVCFFRIIHYIIMSDRTCCLRALDSAFENRVARVFAVAVESYLIGVFFAFHQTGFR